MYHFMGGILQLSNKLRLILKAGCWATSLSNSDSNTTLMMSTTPFIVACAVVASVSAIDMGPTFGKDYSGGGRSTQLLMGAADRDVVAILFHFFYQVTKKRTT